MTTTIIDNAKILKFLELVGNLKHIKRTGWVLRDLSECETIAGHMYRMGMMTFLLTEDHGVDRLHCLQMALVHDLAESIVGDLTPYCGVDVTEKHRREEEAIREISQLIGLAGSRIQELFKEYEEKVTPEAILVKELDKFDMILQAFEYEKREKTPKRLQEFFDSTEGQFAHPFVVGLLSELNHQRAKFNEDYKDNAAKITTYV